MTKYRGQPCPDGHGPMWDWPSSTAAFFCSHSAHGGNGRFFDSDLRQVLTGRPNGAQEVDRVDERAGSSVRPDREALQSRARASTPGDVAGGAHPFQGTAGPYTEAELRFEWGDR